MIPTTEEQKLINQLQSIFKGLDFKNEKVLSVGYDIVRSCVEQGKTDVIVSTTGDNEILFYRIVDGGYKNIVLDEDCDIEFVNIPRNRRNTYNTLLFAKDGYDVNEIVKDI